MATTTESYLNINYTTAAEKNLTLKINDRKSNLTDEQIQAGAEACLASGALGIGGDPAQTLDSAVKVDTTKTDVTIQ